MDAPEDHCVHFLQVRNSSSQAPPRPEDFEVWIVHRSLCRFCCCQEAVRPEAVEGVQVHSAHWKSATNGQSVLKDDIAKKVQTEPKYNSDAIPAPLGEVRSSNELNASHESQDCVVDASSGQETLAVCNAFEQTNLPRESESLPSQGKDASREKASKEVTSVVFEQTNLPRESSAPQGKNAEEPSKEVLSIVKSRKREEYEKMLYIRKKRAQMSSQGNDAVQLLSLSRKFDIDLDTIQDLKDAFDAFDDNCTGLLTKYQFRSLLRSELACNGDDVPDALLADRYFLPKSTTNDTQTVEFCDFVLWYQAHCFEEVLVVSRESRLARNVARKHNLPVGVVQRIHQLFQEHSQMPNRTLRYPEFCRVLCNLLQPQKERLTEEMLGNLWREAAAKRESLDFEVFLLWYLRQFGEIKGSTAAAKSVLQEYLKSLRPKYVLK